MFCALAGLIFLAYACASLIAGRGEFVMPLDDVYIHFQYAKQIALGQPYIYNPGLQPTSGATSFITCDQTANVEFFANGSVKATLPGVQAPT